MTPREALRDAVRIAGGQAALARMLTAQLGAKISQGHVWYWLNRCDHLPAQYVLPTEAATDGRVTRSQLRPDLYPMEAGRAA